MVTSHGGIGGHRLREAALCPQHARQGLGTHPLQSCVGGLWGPSGTKGLMVRPHSPPPQGAPQEGRLGVLPAFPETADDTPYLAERNTISVTKKEHSGGGGE